MLVNQDLKNQFRLRQGPSDWGSLVKIDAFLIFPCYPETRTETSALIITNSLSLRLRKLAYSLWRQSSWSEWKTIHSTLSNVRDHTNPRQRQEPIAHNGNWYLVFGSYLVRRIVLFQKLLFEIGHVWICLTNFHESMVSLLCLWSG